MITVETLMYQQFACVNLQKKYLVNTLGFTSLLIAPHSFHQINLCICLIVTELLKSVASFLLAVLPILFWVIINRPVSFVQWRFFLLICTFFFAYYLLGLHGSISQTWLLEHQVKELIIFCLHSFPSGCDLAVLTVFHILKSLNLQVFCILVCVLLHLSRIQLWLLRRY